MVTGKSTWNKSKIVFYFCLLNICFSCIDKPKTPNDTVSKVSDVKFIQNGDIIYRYGNGFFSKYFRDFSKKEKIYSHSGIINICNDTIFIIHSEADEFTGIGGVKKDVLESFLADASIWGVYRLKYSEAVRTDVANEALIYVRKNTSFDLNFDFKDDNSVYCTELVANCINKATGIILIKPLTQMKEKLFYSIDDTYLIDEMELIYKSE